MSRHRNIKNMVDDYYDEEYDDWDDYDDGYDDYVPAPAPKKVTPKKTPPKKQTNTTVAFASTAKSAAIVKPVAAKKAPSISSSNQLKKGGISAPPPGFSSAPPQSTKGGVSAPPPGFSTAPPSATVSNANPTKDDNITVTSVQSTTPAVAAAPVRPGPLEIPSTLLQNDDPNAKPTLTCVILGHVDAGKSTLTGQLLWANAQKTQRGRKPENFAWLLDEDEQERQHGITMEVATKTLYTNNYRLVLQDAPGHADYVPSMIAGTSAADAAIAVVDATDSQHSALARGQLREHLLLAKGLGVSQVIVALNKMDVLKWDEGQYHTMLQPLQNFLFQSAGFAKNKVTFIPISGLQGLNVHTKLKPEDCPELTKWYNGPTLWEAMEKLELPNPQNKNNANGTKKPAASRQKLLEKPLRLLMTDILQEQGKGVAIRARVVSGWLASHQDTHLTVLPLGDIATLAKMTHVTDNLASQSSTSEVASIPSSSSGDNRANYAIAGDLVDLVIQAVDIARLAVGNVLIRKSDKSLIPTKKCLCKIYVMENLQMPIIRGATAMFHIHSIQAPCFLSKLVKSAPAGAGDDKWKDRPRALTKHSQAVVEITLHQPIIMEAFSDCRALGRFVLRRSGESIAVGRIEKVIYG